MKYTSYYPINIPKKRNMDFAAILEETFAGMLILETPHETKASDHTAEGAVG